MHKPSSISYLLLAVLAAPNITGCGTVKVTESKTFASASAPLPATIYVTNFDLEAFAIQGKGSSEGSPNTPAVARTNNLGAKLADLMAESIMTNLCKAGYRAIRISPETPLSSDGWLLRGSFTSIQKGNLPLRALIGLGAGKTDVQVVCAVDRLSTAPPELMYEIRTDAASGKMPGAMLTPMPGLPVVYFILNRRDLEKNVKKTAAQIAAQIGQQLQHASRADNPVPVKTVLR